MLSIRKIRTKQPSRPTPLDPTHPLYDIIAGVVVPAWNLEVKNGLVGTQAGSIRYGVGEHGVNSDYFAQNTSTKNTFAGDWSKVSAADGYSILSLYRIHTIQSTTGTRIAGNFISSNYGYGFAPTLSNFRFIVARSGANTILTGTATSTNMKCDVGVVDNTNARYYENGVLTAGPTAHSGNVTATGSFSVGADNGTGTSVYQYHYLSIVFKKALPANVVAELSNNPWQIFEPEEILIFDAGTLGPTYTLTCTTNAATASYNDAVLSFNALLSATTYAATATYNDATLTYTPASGTDLTCTTYNATASYNDAGLYFNGSLIATSYDATATYFDAGIYANYNLTATAYVATSAYYDATLTYTPGNTLTCETSTATVTYGDAGLYHNRDAVTQEQGGGWGRTGWPIDYEAHVARVKAERTLRKKLEEEAEKIKDQLDRELAKELLKKAKKEERLEELRRLTALAERNMNEIEQLSPKINDAAWAAIERGTYSVMERLERELARAKEEEEFLMMATSIILGGQNGNTLH